MKRKRLFILICAMLICLASVGCQNISETETKPETEVSKAETESESEAQEMEETRIEASIAVQYSDREFSVYSDTSCFFTIDVNILDIDCLSTYNYGPFEISAGEKMNFTIDELSPDFFSDKAKIKNLSRPSTFVYGDSPLDQLNYTALDAGIQFKCYAEITSYSSLAIQTYTKKTINLLKNIWNFLVFHLFFYIIIPSYTL